MELVNRPSKRQRRDNDASEDVLLSSSKRTSRACDLCRAKKNKCGGQRPRCSACTRAGLECTYGTHAKKRGFPTGYVRVLEALWALVFTAIPDGENTVLTLLQDSVIGHDNDEKVILHNGHFDGHESPRSIWEKSLVRAEIERMVSGLESPAGMDLNEFQSSHVGLSRPAIPLPAWSLPQFSSLDEIATSTPSAERAIISVPNDPEFRTASSNLLNLSPENLEPGPNMPTGASDPMSIVEQHGESISTFPTDSWALIDGYFRFNNCWLPIMPKHDVVRILSSAQEGSGGSVHELTLLRAIFAVASTQSDPNKKNNPTDSKEERVQLYYRQALSTEPHQHAEFCREHVQALLLLAMVDMARDRWQEAYLLVGRATRTLLLWHAHFPNRNLLDHSAGTAPQEPARVLLATFALDTIIAAHLEVLPHLRTRDIEVHLEFDEIGAEEWSQWSTNNTTGASQYHHQPVRALSTFKAYTKLLAILNDLCCTIHTHTPGSRRTDIDQCLRELETWKALLPKHCRVDHLDTLSQTVHAYLPPAANLFVTFEAVAAYVQALEGSCPLALLTGQGIPAILKDCPARRLYDEVFGQSKWGGILHFHNRVLLKAHQPQSPAESAEPHAFGINTQHVVRNVRDQIGHVQRMGARSISFNPTTLQPSMDGDYPFLDAGLPNGRQVGAPGTTERNNYGQLQMPTTVSQHGIDAPQSVFAEQLMISTPSHATSNALYDESFDANTIESLLAELSTTQGSDWNEISSQFRYNLGFTNNDVGLS
ncbi:hypothetical protein H2200_013287 [Cladophialophora chaetospira]|uniref:Zn(2)-C6 fungal-type domain-containing protein n=1 Tax=Cladophialophora chaetospira TaxID=386627 RepID=A0AA38WPG2_9EURO|nr:hypothetical protein H2200_013287 [Cladophialophora chaetospira]